MSSEQEAIIRDIIGLVKKLNGGNLPANFDFKVSVRSKSFKEMKITDIGEETHLINKFRLKI